MGDPRDRPQVRHPLAGNGSELTTQIMQVTRIARASPRGSARSSSQALAWLATALAQRGKENAVTLSTYGRHRGDGTCSSCRPATS